jgi:hypothetical protein
LEYRLKGFENRVLRKTFWPKWVEVRRKERRVHRKELYALYSSSTITPVIKSRGLRQAAHASSIGDSRCAYRVLMGKSEGRRPLGRRTLK